MLIQRKYMNHRVCLSSATILDQRGTWQWDWIWPKAKKCRGLCIILIHSACSQTLRLYGNMHGAFLQFPLYTTSPVSKWLRFSDQFGYTDQFLGSGYKDLTGIKFNITDETGHGHEWRQIEVTGKFNSYQLSSIQIINNSILLLLLLLEK